MKASFFYSASFYSAIVIPLILIAAPAAFSQEACTGFLNKTLPDADENPNYALYVPRDYTPDKAWPLVVFLHGAGERGSDGLLQTEVGLGTAIRRHKDRFPALVLMPQCPLEKFWDSVIPDIEKMMARTQEEYNIDKSRIYLTGLSMGGYGAWLWGGLKTDIFAAIMPICGGGSSIDIGWLGYAGKIDFGSLEERVRKLATVPIWAFHGADDGVVPPERSRQMVRLVREAGGDVEYTEFPKTGHNSWEKAYSDEKAIEWLFKQRKD